MHIVFVSAMTTKERAFAFLPQLQAHHVCFLPLSASADAITADKEAEVLVVDAMAAVNQAMLAGLPRLRLIQSEGVGYQGVDLAAARARHVRVCNNKGINDTAVAEHTLLLILACLKGLPAGSRAVYAGRQLAAKQAAFGRVRELSQCTAGLVGFGDIARETARLLGAFGCRVFYANRTRYPHLEAQYGATYCSLDELLAKCDFVSLHVAVNEETRNLANAAFFSKMRSDAYFINTARGELVDNAALAAALRQGCIAGAGLDVLAPEPVPAAHVLLAADLQDKLVLTPHVAGITSLTVQKLYQSIWQNIEALQNRQPLKNEVLDYDA